MTKRKPGAFKLVPNEKYNTPPAAIDPLIPYLRRSGVKTFVEPCAGDGWLMQYLVKKGFVCVNAGDISHTPSTDARDTTAWRKEAYIGADAVVTNTPWSHKLMVEIMLAQTRHVPGWFLINSDWIFTKQSADIMKARCTDIVPIGRVKWFDNKVGFDNCAWVRMTAFKQPDQFVEFWPFP